MNHAAAAHPLPPSCPNCEADVHGPFCAQCGQETVIEPPTLHEFVHEYLHHYIALEGRLWRSLKLLLTKPGELTQEFLAGRRHRYVRPLPLYVTVSFLFFLLLSITSAFDNIDDGKKAAKPKPATVVEQKNIEPAATGKPTPAEAPSADAKKTADEDGNYELGEHAFMLRQHDGKLVTVPWIDQVFQRSIAHFRADPDTAMERFQHEFKARLPLAIFVLVPLFALGSKLLFIRRRRYYGEHLLFALHVHAYVFLSLLLTYWLPIPFMPLWWTLALWVYLALAFRRVYGGRLRPQLMRSGALLTAHGIALLLGLLCTFTLAALAI